MAYRNHLRVAQYDSALIVVPLLHELKQKDAFPVPKTVAMIYRVDNVCLNFLGFEGDRG
jgi:hypothetical protein